MAEKSLITKASLKTIKQVEGALVDNLYQHANASLSKAHGFQLIVLPDGFSDGNGNDVSFYADSGGDRVGRYFMRITYNNANYYAPVELSMLAGKDPTTGVSPDTNVAVSTAVPGGDAWTTDFTPEDEQDLFVTLNSVLLPHTLLSHWEAHTGDTYQVLPQIVTDSAGHTVSNYVARILVDGVELSIPCDVRLGGPAQPVRASLNYTYNLTGGHDLRPVHPANPPNHILTVTGGTQPITSIKWYVAQAYNSYTYVELVGSSGVEGECIWTRINPTELQTLYGAPGHYLVRVTLTNTAGVTTLDSINDIYHS